MSETTARFALQFLSEGQASAEIAVNENLNALETLAALAILDRDLDTPPGSPADGDAYIVKAAGTDEWEDHDGEIAYYYGGWLFLPVAMGLRAYIDDEKQHMVYDGTKWVPLHGGYAELVFATTMTIDPNLASKQHVVLTDNVTVTVSPGAFNGQRLQLRLEQDPTGSRILTTTSLAYGTTFADSTLTTTAARIDILDLEWYAGISKWLLVGFVKGFFL